MRHCVASGIDHLLETEAFLSQCQVLGKADEVEIQAIALCRSGGLKLPDTIRFRLSRLIVWPAMSALPSDIRTAPGQQET